MQQFFVQNVTIVLETAFTLLVLFFWVACGWIFIGNLNEGWISKSENAFGEELTGYTPLLVDAFYFVTTTITTVGYGDFSAGEGTKLEMYFVMFLEFFGIAMFSVIQQRVLSLKTEKDDEREVNKKLEELETYLFNLDRTLPTKMSKNVYDIALEFMSNSLVLSTYHPFHDYPYFE